MNTTDWATIVAVIVMTVYFSIFATFVFRQGKKIKAKNEERKLKLFKAISKGLELGSINDIDDVANIYKGIAGLSSEDLSYRYGLSKSLREYLVCVVSKDNSVISDVLTDDLVKIWKQKITEFISQNEAISPYADLPSAERNILNDIATFIEKSDLESIKRKTIELAGMIQARDNDLKAIRNINKWTVPLTIIGFVLTIVFGIFALIR